VRSSLLCKRPVYPNKQPIRPEQHFGVAAGRLPPPNTPTYLTHHGKSQRPKFFGRSAFNVGILLIYMFPAMILAVPLFVVFTRLGLRNSLTGLVIVYLAQTLPGAQYMLRR